MWVLISIAAIGFLCHSRFYHWIFVVENIEKPPRFLLLGLLLGFYLYRNFIFYVRMFKNGVESIYDRCLGLGFTLILWHSWYGLNFILSLITFKVFERRSKPNWKLTRTIFAYRIKSELGIIYAICICSSLSYQRKLQYVRLTIEFMIWFTKIDTFVLYLIDNLWSMDYVNISLISIKTGKSFVLCLVEFYRWNL